MPAFPPSSKRSTFRLPAQTSPRVLSRPQSFVRRSLRTLPHTPVRPVTDSDITLPFIALTRAHRSLDPGQDPPDCEATLDGKWSGVEVTELVHRPTLERSIKAVRQRSRGEEPQKPEAYFVWDRDDPIAALQELLAVKDSAKLKRSYEQYVLVIHTDEVFLDSDRVERFLQGASFNTSLITRAFLGLSYEPGKGYPVFALELGRV